MKNESNQIINSIIPFASRQNFFIFYYFCFRTVTAQAVYYNFDIFLKPIHEEYTESFRINMNLHSRQAAKNKYGNYMFDVQTVSAPFLDSITSFSTSKMYIVLLFIHPCEIYLLTSLQKSATLIFMKGRQVIITWNV